MKRSILLVSISFVIALGCRVWFYQSSQSAEDTEITQEIKSSAEREANPVLPSGVKAAGAGLERIKSFSKVEFTNIPKRLISFVSLRGASGAAFSPDSKFLAIGSYPIQVYETRNWKLSRTIPGYGTLAFSPDSKLLAAPDREGKANLGVGIWRLRDGKQLQILNDNSGLLSATGVWGPVEFSPDGHRLLTLGEDPNTKWRPYQGIPGEINSEAGTIRQIALKVWNVESGQRLKVLPGPSWGAYITASVAWIRNSSGTFEPRTAAGNSGFCLVDGHSLGVQIQYPYLTVEDFTTKQLIRNIPFGNDITATAISPDGALIFGGGSPVSAGSRQVKVWRTFDGKLLNQFTGAGDQVQAMTISPDSKMLAITGSSGGNAGSITAIYSLQM